MSTSTYLQICVETQAACEITGAPISSVLSQTGKLKDLVRWVADADVAIQRDHINWNFLYDTSTFSESTIAGSATYTKPATLGKWDRKTFFLNKTLATYQDLSELEYMDWFRNYNIGVQTQNKPTNFIIDPTENVSLYNVPDAVYTLTANFWSAPVRMTANANTSLIPEGYIRAIICKAKMYYAMSEEAMDFYAEASAEYDKVMNQLRADQLPGWEESNISDDVDIVVRPV